MAVTKATGFRFSEEDLSALDAVQRHMGIRTRTEALRALIRSYLRAAGIDVKRKRTAKAKP